MPSLFCISSILEMSISFSRVFILLSFKSLMKIKTRFIMLIRITWSPETSIQHQVPTRKKLTRWIFTGYRSHILRMTQTVSFQKRFLFGMPKSSWCSETWSSSGLRLILRLTILTPSSFWKLNYTISHLQRIIFRNVWIVLRICRRNSTTLANNSEWFKLASTKLTRVY